MFLSSYPRGAGLLTDDRVLVDEHGAKFVRCSRRDGMGIELLRGAGFRMIVLSKERNVVGGSTRREIAPRI